MRITYVNRPRRRAASLCVQFIRHTHSHSTGIHGYCARGRAQMMPSAGSKQLSEKIRAKTAQSSVTTGTRVLQLEQFNGCVGRAIFLPKTTSFSHLSFFYLSLSLICTHLLLLSLPRFAHIHQLQKRTLGDEFARLVHDCKTTRTVHNNYGWPIHHISG